VAQVQGQIESARSDFRQLLQNTAGAASLETGVVRGAIIAGTASQLADEERVSFARFRDGLKDIEIVAFDEVLNRLQGLERMLEEVPTANTEPA
jgi:hypothetical protein